MDIENFIEEEQKYFAPMLDRASKSSEEQKKRWRLETIAQRQERISLEVFDMFQGRIGYGPFKGLKLHKNTWWGKNDLGSMMLGLYEKEILDYIDRLRVDEFSSFIDIGAADGYYACGILHTEKIKKAICFEINTFGQEVIHTNWGANGSKGSLKIFGEASTQSLKELGKDELSGALILIDIEGYEFKLLTDEVLSLLSGSTILIEIHNWVEGFSEEYEKLLRNVSKYFSIEVIERVERPTIAFAELRDFTDDNRLILTSERRPCMMRFLRFYPRS